MNAPTPDPAEPRNARTHPDADIPTVPSRRRRPWLLALAVALLAAAAACVVVSVATTPEYTASALIMIERDAPYIAFNLDGSHEASERYVQTQIELIRSPIVSEGVLAAVEILSEPDVAASADKIAHLQQRLSVDRVNDSDLYRVSYTSKSPHHAAAVANAVVNEYLKIQEMSEYDRYRRNIDLLEEERRSRSLKVEKLRQRVVDLAKEVTGIDPFGYGIVLDNNVARSAVDDVEKQLEETERQGEVVAAQIQLVKERGAKSAGVAPASEPDSKDGPEIVGWRTANADLESLLADIKKADAAWSDNPNFRRLTEKLVEQQTALEKLEAKQPAGVSRSHSETSSPESERLALLEMQQEQLEIKKELLAKDYEHHVAELQTGATKLVELTFAQAELAREEKVFEMIAARKLTLQTESRAPARVSVRQMAAEPPAPNDTAYPRPVLLLIAGAATASAMGLLAASNKPNRP